MFEYIILIKGAGDMKIVVLGLGAWGSALSALLLQNQKLIDNEHASISKDQIYIWARDSNLVDEIADQQMNQRYAPAQKFPTGFYKISHLNQCADMDMAVLAMPMVGLHDVLAQLSRHLPLLLCTKGITPSKKFETPYEYACRLGFKSNVLSGPNLAREIVEGLPCASVIAGKDQVLCKRFISLFKNKNFRLYSSNDPIGVSLCAAAKNVIAIAVAISDGAGLGENARSALITRSLVEIARLVKASKGSVESVFGLAGIGDLMVTATSVHSRNYRFGYALGRGDTLDQALDYAGATVEGLKTAKPLLMRAQGLGIDMPVVKVVNALIEHQMTPHQAVSRL
ncbi:MAG: NAD(P)H-dependent glycerol-3-phosphate dehydrogenase, partial [Pseudomonadota bacterium]